MFLFQRYQIRRDEFGLHFDGGEFQGLLGPGTHWLFDPFGRVRVDVVSQREPWLAHEQLDAIVQSGVLADRAVVLDLKDHERALVWIDGRFSHVLPPGLYAYWTGYKDVRVELVDARQVRFVHPDLKVIAGCGRADDSLIREHLRRLVRPIPPGSPLVQRVLDICTVERNHAGVLFVDGDYADTLPPGLYAFWKGAADARVVEVDLRETTADIGGQEIMTADKVTLRVNAVVTYRIANARQAVSSTDDARQALYRETQLALRAAIGARELDAFPDRRHPCPVLPSLPDHQDAKRRRPASRLE